MSHVFVTEFPAEDAMALGTAIVNKSLSLSLWKNAWVVAEYALEKYVPDTTPFPAPTKVDLSELPSDIYTEDEIVEAGQHLIRAARDVQDGTSSHAVGAIAIPWSTIIPIILQLLAGLIKK